MSARELKERETLEAIRTWSVEHGRRPSVRQLGKILGVQFTTAAARLRVLEKRGVIQRQVETATLTISASVDALNIDKSIASFEHDFLSVTSSKKADPQRTSTVMLSPAWDGNKKVTQFTVRDDEMAGDGIVTGDVAVVLRDVPIASSDLVGVRIHGADPIVRCVRFDGQFVGIFGRPGATPRVVHINAVEPLGRLVAVLR